MLYDVHGIEKFIVICGYTDLQKGIEGLINANCWAHARRDFADACKAGGKTNQQALRSSVAHQALELIAGIYKADEALKDLSCEDRLKERKTKVAPLVEAFFAWVREQVEKGTALSKGKTSQGLNYCLNHEKYLKVFLTNGNVPIDNSASERAIRPFCIGEKKLGDHQFDQGSGSKCTGIQHSRKCKAE